MMKAMKIMKKMIMMMKKNKNVTKLKPTIKIYIKNYTKEKE